MKPLSEIFDVHYTERAWDSTSGSGPGSDPAHCRPYIEFVQMLLHANQNYPHFRVIDWGCGDGRVAEAILSGVPRSYYQPYDVSPVALEKAKARLLPLLQRHYIQTFPQLGEPGVPPPVDEAVVLVKDVICHLSRAVINELVPVLRKAKMVVFCHDDPIIWPGCPADIKTGDYRPITFTSEGCLPDFSFPFPSFWTLKLVEVFFHPERLQLVHCI